MEEKKGVKISTLFLILAIIVIVIMGGFIYKLNNDKTTEIQKSTELQSQLDNLNKTVGDLQEKLDGISNIVSTDDEEKAIDVNSSIVKNAYAKVEGAGETLYEYINKNDLPNKVKLVLGYHNLKEESLKSYSDEEFQKTGNSYYFSTEALKDSIADVLGNEVEFYNEDFSAYRIGLSETLKYNEKQSRYDTNFEFGGDSDYFKEIVVSASTQGDYLKFYVKPVFFKLEFDKYGSDANNYDAYSGYNYSNNEFINKIQEKVSNIDDVDNSKLDTYKYTFLKIGDNYYFDSLQKVD